MGKNQKWPRQYAAEIAALPTSSARKKAMNDVPESCRCLTMTHVRLMFELRKFREKMEQKT